MIIRIGKAADNDFVVSDPLVSRYHAQLTLDKDGSWLLEDLESTNGTFVNGNQILKKLITSLDTILLGDNYKLDLSEVLKSANDYSDNFLELQGVFDRYVEEKLKIQSGNMFKTRVFQSVPFALIGLIGLMIGLLGKGNPILLGISLFVAVCAPVIGIYLGAKQSAKTPRQLQELINQFKIDYVCPKCGSFLGEIPWESLRNKKQCPVSSCKARWMHE